LYLRNRDKSRMPDSPQNRSCRCCYNDDGAATLPIPCYTGGCRAGTAAPPLAGCQILRIMLYGHEAADKYTYAMRTIFASHLAILGMVAWPADLQSAPQENGTQAWPWKLNVSMEEALKVSGFGPFMQKEENQFQSEPSTFLGEKAVTTLSFQGERLNLVRVDMYEGSDKEKALECWCKLFAWQKALHGEVITFHAPISRRANDSEVRIKTEEWLAAKPEDKVVKLFTNCIEKGTPQRFVTFLVRTPQKYLVYTVYGYR